MKKLLVIVALLLTTICNAQSKGDNTIIILTTKSVKEIKEVLFKEGFIVEGADTSFFITTAKEMNASSLRLIINKTDTSIILKGQAKIQVELMGIKNDFVTVEYRPSKQNLNHQWFLEMDNVAKLISNNVRYTKQ